MSGYSLTFGGFLLLGGRSGDLLGRRSAFATFLLVPRVVKESRAEGLVRHFDAVGAFTVTASLMLFIYALTRTTHIGWATWVLHADLAARVVLQ